MVSLVVADHQPFLQQNPSNYVVISGTATCDDQDIWEEARRIIARYRAPEEVDDYLARWKTEPRVLVAVTPERISTRASGRR